jgi:hypothetical protein
VWNDLNGDGVRVEHESALEPEVRGVTVVLYEPSDRKVAQRKSNKRGDFAFTDVPPGDYYLEFAAPAGFAFVDPSAMPDVDLDALMTDLEIDETMVIVSDTVEVWSEGEGDAERWFARTAVITVEPGDNEPVADAALYEIPEAAAAADTSADAAATTGDTTTSDEEPAPEPTQPSPNTSAPPPPSSGSGTDDGSGEGSGDGDGEPPADGGTDPPPDDPAAEPPPEEAQP